MAPLLSFQPIHQPSTADDADLLATLTAVPAVEGPP